jgi:hypothetical protein
LAQNYLTLPINRYESFIDRFIARGNSMGMCEPEDDGDGVLTSECRCSDATDDAGHMLFQRDHDDDEETPMRCAGSWHSNIPSARERASKSCTKW